MSETFRQAASARSKIIKAVFVAKQLKVFQTSLGFFDLAIAAPSMKAALDAWGAKSNLFHQGIAHECTERGIIAATMEKPGVILRRPVGSNGPFRERAELPSHLDGQQLEKRPGKPRLKPEQQPRRHIDRDGARATARVSAREHGLRESKLRKQEIADASSRVRRLRATAKAHAALERAERKHAMRRVAIAAELAAIDQRLEAEDARWEAEKQKLERVLNRVRD